MRVLVAKNCSHDTGHGIKVLGLRLANEIEQVMTEFDCKPDFYMIGHSLGGLIARWALGYLYSRGFFDSVTP